MVQLKEEVARLSTRQQRELNAHLVRLRHQTPAWRKTLSRRMKEMDAGKRVTLAELELQMGRA